MTTSPALQLVQSRGWSYEEADATRIRLMECPYCGKHSHPAFVMEIHGPDSPTPGRDGVHMCHRCGKTGSLPTLREKLGITIPGVTSFGGGKADKIDELPDIDAAHAALMEDEDALDYFENRRGFSREIIEKQKIGIVPKRFFREVGEVKAIVYPYLVNGQCVFVHYRSLPVYDEKGISKVHKAFNSPKGWDAPLYNGEVLREGLKEVFFVEGEANCIAAMDHGVSDICGVPGANFKKAEWIDQLDKLTGLERIYVCYDKDRPGQKAAQTLAAKIGIERCWKIVLPDFIITDDEGKVRPGKDLNEWFAKGGGTAEEFDKLKEAAAQFDVDGVNSSKDALGDLEDEINGKETLEPTYSLKCWPSLAKLVGFDPGDVIDIVAEEKIGKTTFGLNIMEYMVETYGEDGVVICLEMTIPKLTRKWVAHVAGVEDNVPKTPEQAKALKEAFLEGITVARSKSSGRAGTLYFCYPQYSTSDDLVKLIRDIIRRYGVKWIMIDNIQRWCDTTVGSKNRTQHMSEISKVTSRIAKDYEAQVIRIIQPRQIGENKIASSRDADGSSQIRKDCDCSIALHRNKVGELSRNDFETLPYVEQDQAFDEKMLVSNDLSRYSGGGYTTLRYDGARSTVTEYNIAQIAAIKSEATKAVNYGGQLASLVASTKVDKPADKPKEDAAQKGDTTNEITI